ncbi:hypothetical protein MRB53_008339 [Persea americana]|uniref:Uncharacterized protein n=1 Tax=Persea americana TaxID=3435 RepID=A0ACC2MLT5_PERAE|nr:hypothetical protein MRB53_008339 [Persea americana]
MSTKGGTMATRGQTLVLQSLSIHNKGGTAKARTDGSKAQQKPGLTKQEQQFLNQILPLDDEKSPLELWSPKTPSTILNQPKVNFASTPKYLDFIQSPISLKY